MRYKPSDAAWSVTGYVRNMFNYTALINEAYSSNAQYLPASDPNVLYGYRTSNLAPPRTFGFIAQYDF